MVRRGCSARANQQNRREPRLEVVEGGARVLTGRHCLAHPACPPVDRTSTSLLCAVAFRSGALADGTMVYSPGPRRTVKRPPESEAKVATRREPWRTSNEALNPAVQGTPV